MTMFSGPAGIVMPHFTRDTERTGRHLFDALAGLAAQSDPDWRLFIVDDASPVAGIASWLREAVRGLEGRATVMALEENRGAGYARNVGVALAAAAGCSFVAYNDADDVSPSERVATTRAVLHGDPDISVVFGAWEPVDEHGASIPRSELVPHLQRILGEIDGLPPRIEEPFLRIAVETGYFMLTSATSARIALARAHPWPSEYSVEDLHTWYRYGAHGGAFAFRRELVTRYRVTSDNAGSTAAERYGGADAFWSALYRLELDGFTRALDIAVARGTVDAERRYEIAAAFHQRTADVWELCDQPTLRAQSLALRDDNLRLALASPAPVA
jgi:glycosyltransferase involved in cell wall biosynthesis